MRYKDLDPMSRTLVVFAWIMITVTALAFFYFTYLTSTEVR
jgi:hypothetical protein